MLIIVAKKNDPFTDCVIHKLIELDLQDIILINEDDELFIEHLNLSEQKIVIRINEREINFDNISLFWYRGGILPIPKHDWITKDMNIAQQVKSFINYEWKVLRDYLFYVLQQKRTIGNFFLAETNKLRNLHIAQECRMSIPDTYIMQNNFSEILKKGHSSYITKPIGECLPFIIDQEVYRSFTTKVKRSYLENSSQIFFPSLLQNKINIDFEIRVFIFYESQEFYAMAVFPSQLKNDSDYRKSAHANRYARYDLPTFIKRKLLLFMKKMHLDTASFDLTKTKDGDFIFLEVNPYGNIEMINEICLYGIDKRFAEIIYNKYC